MSSYLTWNDGLAAHFFNPEAAGRPVYLFVNEELISGLGTSLVGGLDDFVSAIKEGPPWGTREGLCQRALQALHNWRAGNLTYPPYIAYLAVFVLAAGSEGDFAPHAYYPRLRRLLGYPDGSMLPSYDRMFELWDDLERWSTQDMAGKWGMFKARIVGNWLHVGLPIAQTILAAQERRALPWIFSQAGLDPTSAPPGAELARALRTYGAGHLRPRTLKLVGTRHDEELYEVLLDTVAEELAEWDGQVDGTMPAAATETRTFAVVRLCLAVDLVADRVQATLRLRLNREFPEGRLALSAPGVPSKLLCDEFLQGWSSPLQDGETRRLVDAGQFNWVEGLVLKDERLGWQFRLHGRPVRVFVNGAGEGLPGLLEVYALPRSQPFYLLYKDECWAKLSSWAREECRDFTEHRITEGLPVGWRLGSAREARGDAKVRDHFPFLSFSSGVRLRFVGGIRSSAGNNFFAFAPPELRVEGGDGSERILCDGQVLRALPDGQFYELPAQLPLESRISIELQRGERVVSRQSLYLTGDFSWRWEKPSQEFDRWGAPVEIPESQRIRVVGAAVTGEVPDASKFRRHVLFMGNLEGASSGRVFFVGRWPGEIACWPAETLPQEWDPIWAISLGRRGRAIYCGGNPGDSIPAASPRGDRRRVDLWKDVLWHRRKRIAPPKHRALLRLWKQFQDAARDV